ncbi:cupredoxin domain-containing protein [Candidatus Nomurabacteria bacterium]|nr:cupredoxin domain-containing protein [Candidatus Nomurabacteria bacterium]
MNKKVIVPVVLVLIVVVSSMFLIARGSSSSKNFTNSNAPVKEFSMTSFTDMVNGEPKPQFSLKEITVNKGDKVRIKITEVSGMHNFVIDEFGVYKDTPLNQETVVEFVADKTGEFVYYCSKPGHRQNGQWGTLKVI